MALNPGSRIGHYEVVGTVGRGGMGEVYRARDTKLGRDVAMKILPDAFAADPIGWRASSAKHKSSRRSIIHISHRFTASKSQGLFAPLSWSLSAANAGELIAGEPRRTGPGIQTRP